MVFVWGMMTFNARVLMKKTVLVLKSIIYRTRRFCGGKEKKPCPGFVERRKTPPTNSHVCRLVLVGQPVQKLGREVCDNDGRSCPQNAFS